jgi:hypothetical protein
VASLVLGAGSAFAALPDLKQEAPSKVSVSGGSGGGQIVFQSEVTNVGSGPLEVHGHRSSTSGNMTADQIIHNGGSTTTVAGIGDLHYETGFGHQHWHFEPFDHYELRTLDGTLVGTDVKQGFCLGDNNNHGGGSRVFTDFCKQNQPDALEVTEGISPGWGDSYDPGKEGQSIPISSSTVPPGLYDVVHRVNENTNGSPGPVQESSFGNNVASAEVQINWSSGTPSLSVLKTCTGTASCAGSTTTTTTTTTTSSRTSTTRTTTTTHTTTVSTTTTTQTPNVVEDTKPPTLVLQRSSREHFGRRSATIAVFASCDEECMFSARGTVSVLQAAKLMQTGRSTVELPPGVITRVRLHLSHQLRRRILRALRHHRRVIVKVKMTAIDSSDNVTRQTQTIRLVR